MNVREERSGVTRHEEIERDDVRIVSHIRNERERSPLVKEREVEREREVEEEEEEETVATEEEERERAN